MIGVRLLRLWPALVWHDRAAKHGLDLFEECRTAERPADGFRPAQAVVDGAVVRGRVEQAGEAWKSRVERQIVDLKAQRSERV